MKSIEDIKALIQRDYNNKLKKFMVMEPCDYVLVGDSMVAYFKPSLPWCMQGIAGDTTIGLLNRIHAIKHVHPKRVIIHIGTNDLVLTNLTLDETVNNMKNMKKQLDQVEVLFCTPIPVDENMMSEHNRLRTNASLMVLRKMMIETFDKQNIIDMHPLFDQEGLPKTLHIGDGLHLNKKGYHVYEQVLTPYMSGDI